LRRLIARTPKKKVDLGRSGLIQPLDNSYLGGVANINRGVNPVVDLLVVARHLVENEGRALLDPVRLDGNGLARADRGPRARCSRQDQNPQGDAGS